MFDPAMLRLCLITDRALAGARALVDLVGAAVQGGVTMVQLREKHAPTRVFLEDARALKALLAGTGVPLVINDRIDIALAVKAEGVHVGQTDMPIAAARALVGDMFIGLSTTTAAMIAARDAAQADYLGLGPLFPQRTKADAAAPLGIKGFAALRSRAQKPVVAIGGVDAESCAAILAAGADGIAVVSAIVAADDPRDAARRLRAIIDAAARH